MPDGLNDWTAPGKDDWIKVAPAARGIDDWVSAASYAGGIVPGAAEALIQGVGGFGSMLVAGGAGVGGAATALAAGESPKENFYKSVDTIQALYEKHIAPFLDPETRAGKDISKVLEYLPKGIRWAGEKATDITGRPEAGAITEGTLNTALLGFGRGKGKAKVAADVPRETTPQPAPAPVPVSREFPIAPEPAPAPRKAADIKRPRPAEEAFPAAQYGQLDDVLPLAPKPAPAPEPFALATQTEADLAAKTARAGNESVATQQAMKRQSEVEAGQFQLAGDEKPAAVREAEGKAAQGDLLALPPAGTARAAGKPRTLLGEILDMGGIDSAEGTMRDITGETRARQGIPANLFRKDGKGLDELATGLRDRGYLIPEDAVDGGVQALRNMIRDEVDGVRKHGSAFDEQAQFDKLARVRDEKFIEEDRALQKFGPGTLGANRMLDPAAIAQTGRAAKEAVSGMLRDVLGEPGKDRSIFLSIRNTEQTNINRLQRWVTGEIYDIKQAFPTKAAREDLTMRIVRGDDVTGWAGLTPAQKVAANKLKADWDRLQEYSRQSGRDVRYRQNYSPNIWDTSDKPTKDKLDSWRAMRGEPPIQPPGVAREAGAGTVSPHMLPRQMELEEGLKAGLKPLSLDAADLLGEYVNSMAVAVERGRAFNSLANLRTSAGDLVQLPIKEAPKDYVKVNNPELEGFRFHPETAPDIKVLMESKDPGVIRSTLQTLAYTAKRVAVTYSFFHPMAMGLAWLGTKPGLKAFNPKAAIDAALKVYREGGVGDELDRGLRNGLRLTPPIEDVVGREKFKAMFDKASEMADRLLPGHAAAGGKSPIRIAKKLDEKLQQFMWPYEQTGFKIDIYLRAYEFGRKKHAKALADGTMTEDKVAEQAAKFTNAVEGGVNWERMLDYFETPAARKVMSEVLSKSGRANLQIGLFAPDWLISTISTWTSGLRSGEANAIKASLSRRYLALSAIGTFGIGSAVNYYFVGHSMFENKSRKKDPTWQDELKVKLMIDLGDGTYINPNKHFMEALHLVAGPFDFAYNKMNPVASEPLEFAANRQWMAGEWAPPITEKGDPQSVKALKQAKHFASKFVPITARQLAEQGMPGTSGFAGFPLIGMTEEQKARAREERQRER